MRFILNFSNIFIGMLSPEKKLKQFEYIKNKLKPN